MSKTLVCLLTLLFAALPAAHAQSPAELRRELQQRERDAGNDCEQLLDLAEWAKSKGLIRDRQRLLDKVLKLEPDNERANTMLGLVKYEGEWMPPSKADMLRRKAMEKEMKARGMVEVDGCWVTKDEVDDAKKGIFHHDGEIVSAVEKRALQEGKVRHPGTGEFIDPADLAKAEAGQFLVAGRWADEAEANDYHADARHPWLIRTSHSWLISTRPLAQLKEIAGFVDSGIESVTRIFQGAMPSPAFRPVILITKDDDEFRQLGTAVGAEGSAYSVFVAEADFEVRDLGTCRPVICNWKDDWGQYWARDAGALGYVYALCTQNEIEAPLWFLRGVGGYAERHYLPGVAKWFGTQHLEKGGVKDVKGWFERFEISGNLTAQQLDYNIYQAGLVIDFALSGKNAKVTEAMLKVTEAFTKGDSRGAARAFQDLQKEVSNAEEALREHLRSIVQGS
ncbi:MAG: hypothetical protein IPM29_32010 [Planctomycetes bacterium]|nr:hypothetical protein [Planctomycetota bacterium]